ncbi:transcriptional regulator [Bradyrhizobium sp. MOS002]|nr:transcriptional regulator [Bradyrhizobium sp. MOS002]
MSGRKSIQKVSIRQVKAARALLAWSQEDLAEAASVSIPTIKRLEALDGPLGGRPQTIEKIITALSEAGIRFTGDDGGTGVHSVRTPKHPKLSRSGA